MKRYQFRFIDADNPEFEEKDHIIFADSLLNAIGKFELKHHIEAPAYLDLPSYDKFMEIHFKDSYGYVKYMVTW